MAADVSVTITMRGKLWEVKTVENGQVTKTATYDNAPAADRAAKTEQSRLGLLAPPR